MILHNYHPRTLEYIGATEAQLDPKASQRLNREVFLIPAYATGKEPPKCKENEVAVFKNNRWYKKKDFRGTKYFDSKGIAHVITKIGDVVPKDCTLSPPTPKEHPMDVKRRRAYGTIQEQLDMLYWDMMNGTDKWKRKITKIKKKYKKKV